MNKKAILSYPCIFTEENNEFWGQFIAPLDGIFSRGKNLAECIEDSKEALGAYLMDLNEYPEYKFEQKSNIIICFNQYEGIS